MSDDRTRSSGDSEFDEGVARTLGEISHTHPYTGRPFGDVDHTPSRDAVGAQRAYDRGRSEDV